MIVINKMVCSVQWCCNHCVKNTSITVNKYRFCISAIGHINKQIIGIGIGSKKSISVDHYTSHHPHVLNVYFGVFWYVLFHVSDGSIGEEATGRNDVISELH